MPIVPKSRYTVIVQPEYQQKLIALAKSHGVTQGMLIECMVDMILNNLDASHRLAFSTLALHSKTNKVDGRKANAEMMNRIRKLTPEQRKALLDMAPVSEEVKQ